MSTGVTLPSIFSISTSASQPLVGVSLTSGPLLPGTATFGSVDPNQVQTDPRFAPHNTQWTPPQWSQPGLTVLAVTYPPYTIDDEQANSVTTYYIFDAVFKLIHRRILRKTSHPVLTGANISDHAFIEPARVSLEIGMSDAMASYTASMWSNSFTKSVSAWLKIKEFQLKKLLITLVTRLDTYENMMVIEAESPDDNVSRHGLRANIILEELISATVYAFPPSSPRDQTVQNTTLGTVQSQAPNQDLVQQHVIPSTPVTPTNQLLQQGSSISGAGKVDSNSIWNIFTPPTTAAIP